MYDELVKRLHDGAKFLETSTPGIKNSFANMCHNAADAIEELTALSRRQEVELVELTGELASKPRWIPVEERLPEKYHQVLVYGLNGMQIDYYAGEKSIGGRPLFMISEAKVTHWTPLPEPPKEET